MLCGTLARELGGDACFISIFLLHAAAATLFPGSERGREQEVSAGWPDCSAELLSTGWRVLAAKQTENLQRELINTSAYDVKRSVTLENWPLEEICVTLPGQTRSSSDII